MKHLFKTALLLAVTGGAALLAPPAEASDSKFDPASVDAAELTTDWGSGSLIGPAPDYDQFAPLYSNIGTDNGGFLLNGAASTSGTTRYTPMVCSPITLSQPGPQQITNFAVFLRNQNAASFTPSSTAVYFYDANGANGGPGARLGTTSGVYVGGLSFTGPAIPVGAYGLNAAPLAYTAPLVNAAQGEYGKIWACVYFTGTSAMAASLANLGLEKFDNAPTSGSTEDKMFVTSSALTAAAADNPVGTITSGGGNVFGWRLTTLGTRTLVDSFQVKSTSNGQVGTSGLALNPGTGVEKKSAGFATTIAAPTGTDASWNITGVVLYPSPGSVAGSFTNVQAKIKFWDTFNGSAAADVFGEATPVAETLVDLGPLSIAANNYQQVPIRFDTPVAFGASTSLGVTVQYLTDTGSGPVADGSLSNIVNTAPSGNVIAVGVNASTSAQGWYKSASDRADLNFTGASDYVATTRQHQAIRVYGEVTGPTHTVSISTGGPGAGAISPSGDIQILGGTSSVVTLTPDPGNHVISVTGTCGGTLSGNTFTTVPITEDCTVIANFGPGVGTNGVYYSPVVNHAIMNNADGSTINLVTHVIDDTGPYQGPWDVNFYASSSNFTIYPVATYAPQFALNGSVSAVLQPGDVVGPSLTWGSIPAAGNAPWRATADGYLGVRFTCSGRLPYPVSGGVCYGYIHLTTTASSGFPATIVEFGYDGDGNALTIPSSGTSTKSVTSSASAGGLIDPTGTIAVVGGQTASYTLYPDAGYHVESVDGTCGGTLEDDVFTTAPVTEDCTVEAVFALDPPPTYAVGGTIDGLTADGLSLTLNDGTPLEVDSGATTFLFDEELEDGAVYAVEIATQPDGLECELEAGTGSGTIDGADVTDVAIACDEVTPPSPLELAITVAVDNGDPDQCGTDTSVTVAAYTKINVCYALTNNSTDALNYHTLADTQLGTLLDNAGAAVAPGETVHFNYVFVAAEAGAFTPEATWTANKTSGGVAGYVANPNAPYNYTDISTTGTSIFGTQSSTDDAVSNITLPFNVTLFGVSDNRLRVGNNGAALFNTTTGNVGYAPVALPATATSGNSQLGGAAFVPFWTDFHYSQGGVRWQVLGAEPNRTAVIQWRRNHWNGNATGSNSSNDTGEVQLLLGEDGSIVFNYVDVTFNATSPANGGAYASIGLQGGNTAGSPAAQYSFATTSVVAGQAISWNWAEPAEYTAEGSYAFAVTPAPAPAIAVVPEDGLDFTLGLGASDSEELTIGNEGDAGSTLHWSVAEVLVGARGAGTAVITDRAQLIARLGSDYYEEAFDSVTSGPSDPLSFSSGAYSYDVASAGSGLYNDTGLISVNESTDRIVVTFTSPVTAVGGNFWATDVNVAATGTAIVATLNDGTTLTVPTSSVSTFIGFVSAAPILSLTIDAPGASNYWPTLDNLIVGSTVGGVNGCQDVADVPWLSVSPTSGALAAGATADSVVTVDSTGLNEGSYSANLCVASNDGTNPLVSVPVSLTVTEAQEPTTADLSVTIVASPTQAQIGQTVAYTIVASNIGPGDVAGAHLTDTPPARLGDVVWSCDSATGTTCPTPSEDDGPLDTAVDLPSGASITFTLTGTVLHAANPDDDYTPFGNQAVIALPKGSELSDPVAGNNTGTATVTVVSNDIFKNGFED